jgi:hypothetical protein
LLIHRKLSQNICQSGSIPLPRPAPPHRRSPTTHRAVPLCPLSILKSTHPFKERKGGNLPVGSPSPRPREQKVVALTTSGSYLRKSSAYSYRRSRSPSAYRQALESTVIYDYNDPNARPDLSVLIHVSIPTHSLTHAFTLCKYKRIREFARGAAGEEGKTRACIIFSTFWHCSYTCTHYLSHYL